MPVAEAAALQACCDIGAAETVRTRTPTDSHCYIKRHVHLQANPLYISLSVEGLRSHTAFLIWTKA